MTTLDGLRDILDCGDSGCILRDRSKPSGMRTNGGCQHLTGSPQELRAQARAMGAEIVRLRAEVSSLIARLEAE